MQSEIIENIIIKFLFSEANTQELTVLNTWLQDERNASTFSRFVKTELLITGSMAEYDIVKAKKTIGEKLKKAKRKNRLIVFGKTVITASILLFLGIFLFKTYNTEAVAKKNIAVEAVGPATDLIQIGTNKAILTLDNGNEVVLEKGKQYEKGEVKSNGTELIYYDSASNESDKSISYNYLTIPRGGQFYVKLSDGTEVWLNSESKLKYPKNFIEGEKRIVELVYGEGYFKVSPSTLHNGSPFYVSTKSQEIHVLGTEFNIKAYKEEHRIATTLVEGSVNISKESTTKTLKPNQQSIISASSSTIAINNVDVSQETAWLRGLFIFNEESLDELLVSLSRWYDADIVFQNAEHKDFIFTGILERTDKIENILNLITATSDDQISFKIDEKVITIK